MYAQAWLYRLHAKNKQQCDKMATVQAVIDFHPSNRQPKNCSAKVVAYNCMQVSIKKRKSLFRLAVGDLGTR